MEWHKAKNIIIALLLLVNLFLLGLLGYQTYDRQRVRQEAVEGTVRYLASRGIAIAPGLIPGERYDRRLSIIQRGRGQESAAAAALIGESVPGGSGGIDRYRSDQGTVVWRLGGLVEAEATVEGIYLDDSLWSAGSETQARQPQDAALALAAAAGFAADAEGVLYDGSGGGDSLTLRQEIDGLPVFNCSLLLQWDSADRLRMSGRWCFGQPQTVSDSAELDITGLLVEYVRAVSALAVERIDALEPGWVVQAVPNLGARLVPVWRIQAGEYVTYLHAITGNPVTLE